MSTRRKTILIAMVIASLVSFIAFFNNPELPLVIPVHAASVHFTLYADYLGWNLTKPSGANPTMTVTQGDSVSLTLIGDDALTHLFLLDLDGNGGSVLDCPGNDICSGNIAQGQTVTVPSFTVNFAPGPYKYYCYYHFTTMVGNFIVQGFKINPNPTSLTVNQGASGTSTIAVTSVSNFAGTVNLAASVSPGGPMVSVSPNSVTLTAGNSGSSTLTFSAISGTSSGAYTVTVTGTSGSASSTASVTVTVSASSSPDFTISSNPTTVGPLSAGASGTSTITVSPVGGFTGTVTLTTAPSAGLSASVSPTSITGGSGTSSLTASAASAGTYTVTVTGTSGSLSHSVTVTVTVSSDFSISSSPSSLTVAQGSSGTSTITVTSLNGFSGTVSLSPSVSPSGPQVSVSPASVTLSSSGSASATLTVSATSSGLYSPAVSQGSYTVTVTGTGSSLSHSASVSLTVGSTSSPPSGVGSLPTSLIIGVIVAAVAAVAVAIYIIRRKPKT